MEERKVRELNYKVQMINVKLMSRNRSGDAAYLDIIKKINQNKISIPIRGDRHMILRTMFKNVVEVNGKNWDVLYGNIATYTVIDGKDWINLESMEVQSVDLPKHLFPNLKESDFFFVPGAHRMAFVVKSGFSANSVEKFLSGALAQVVDEDEDFFQLALPGIVDVTEDNRELVLEACNKTNFGIKVIKCCIPRDDVWVFFEILLDSSPELQDIFPRALAILQGAQQQFYQNMQ